VRGRGKGCSDLECRPRFDEMEEDQKRLLTDSKLSTLLLLLLTFYY